MNKQIKQLAEQAGFYFDEYNEPTNRKADLFAELIVKECMSNLYLHGYDDAVVQIQKHFGVEE